MPREGHGSRNVISEIDWDSASVSCPARGMGVEMKEQDKKIDYIMSCPARGMGVEMKKQT